MQIFVQKPEGNTVTLDVESREMISSVKRKLEDKEGIPFPSDVLPILYYVGKQLDDWRTLADYNILSDSTLHLFLVRKSLPHIYVETENGTIITLKIAGLNTIDDVKAKIYEQEGIPPDQQRLVFAGKELDGNERLLESHIGMESTLLIATPIGGRIKNPEGRYKLRKHSAPQVAPQQTKRARFTEASPNCHSIVEANDGEVCADYIEALTTSVDPQPTSDNIYEAKLNVFALHQAKATAVLNDLMPEFRARPRPSVLTELEDVRREMAQKSEVFSGQCVSYESQIVALKAQNSKTEEELMIACNKEKILEATISVLTHKNRTFSAQCASYESEIVSLKGENKRTEEVIKVARNKENELEATITRLTHQNNTISAQCASYESQILALEADGKKTEEELMVAHTKEKELEATIFRLKAKNEKTEEELMIACNKEMILEATIAGLTHTNKTISAQCAFHENQIAALEADGKKTEEKLMVAHNKEKKDLEASIFRLRAKNEKTEEELTVGRNKEKELEATISLLKHKNKTFSTQCAFHENQIVALEVDGKKAKEELTLAHSKEKELEATITRLKVENEKTEEELKVTRNKEKELEATISGLTQKNKRFSWFYR